MRYEEPSSMVRWDAPLFTVLWSDDDVPGEDMWKAITQGIVKPPNAGTQAVCRFTSPFNDYSSKPTSQVAKAPSDALRSLENATTAMVSGILAAQSASGGAFGGPTSLSPTPGGPSVRIDLPPRNITIAELQRLKRAFVTIHKKATTLGTTEKGVVDWGEESVAAKFAVYLEENLKP
jgi:protein KTI12